MKDDKVKAGGCFRFEADPLKRDDLGHKRIDSGEVRSTTYFMKRFVRRWGDGKK